jgi:hypothetical protein
MEPPPKLVRVSQCLPVVRRASLPAVWCNAATATTRTAREPCGSYGACPVVTHKVWQSLPWPRCGIRNTAGVGLIDAVVISAAYPCSERVPETRSRSLPFRGKETFIRRGQVDISTRGDL